MLIDSLTFAIENSGAMEGYWDKLDAHQDATLGVAASARPFMAAATFAHRPQTTLVLVAGEDAATAFARNMAAFLGDENVLRFPARSDCPFNPRPMKPSDMRAVSQRLRAMNALMRHEPVVVVASAQALLRMLPPVEEGVQLPIMLRVGADLTETGLPGILETAELDDVVRALEARGYENTGELDGPGTFCLRGGSLDVYPGNLTYPVRIDFFGDEVDEIRRIVPATGQTISSLRQVCIYPVQEFIATPLSLYEAKKKLERPAKTNPALRNLFEQMEGGLRFDGADVLLPYIYKDTVTLGAYADKKVMTLLVEPRSLFDDATHAYEEYQARAHEAGLAINGLYAEPTKLDFGAGTRATHVSIMRVGGSIDVELPVKRADVSGHPDKLFGRSRSLLEQDYTLVFSVANFRAREDMKLEFVDHELPIQSCLDEGRIRNFGDPWEKRVLRRGVVNIVDVDIPLGLIIPKAKVALISINDTQGAVAGSAASSRSSRRVDITELTFPYKPGDYVVHAAHGVALFKELITRELDGTCRDYLHLEYAEGDKLFVPVEQLDRVTRYVGPEGSSPRLTRLNTSDWSRALAKAGKATKKLAFDLVEVYSRRAASQGFRFGPDTDEQLMMEAAFPYQETPDQMAAIQDVKADMESNRPMDRLICGDVGFGKTEVALRAAFKATQAGKQVMVLCPTTILAQQHYTLFQERFDPYGVSVQVLSRFRTPAQQKAALEGFADGSVSVLVGTHRLLSRDVNPFDLGLVIIDEEQRFGVGHKEQLKTLRESIDVLTLSATPIPRTMQMSLSGVRDMSVIMTPPPDRLPVKVHVGEWDPDVVSAAIRYELARGGQVYYVSNRVRSIEEAVRRVVDAAPEARIGVGHGQMSKEALESVMEDFSAGELDVLVATTIIESGIDNPHTNTLIIEDAQRLGLAQMYQLKGRVGRSSTQAFAYFMFPEHMELTQEAQARLLAIDEHQDLGSGMRIAMRDLEIRGAGSLLGAEQSGNMSAVGFDLYAQMLAAAVNAARDGLGLNVVPGSVGAGSSSQAADSGKGSISSELPPALSDITVNIPGHAYLADEYVPDVDERVLWYRKIASADTVDAVDAIEADLREKHPDMPEAAENLLAKARIKAFASENGIRNVSVAAGKLSVEPVTIPRALATKIRRAGGRHSETSNRLTVPLRYFTGGSARPSGTTGRTGSLRNAASSGRSSAASRVSTRRVEEVAVDESKPAPSLFTPIADFLKELLASE